MQSLPGTVVLGVATGSVYAIVALGFALTFRASGVVDFARGPLVILAALLLLAMRTTLGIPGPLAVIAVVVALALVGVLQYLTAVALLPRGDRVGSSIVATLGFGIVLTAILLAWFGSGTRAVDPIISGGVVVISGVIVDDDLLLTIPVAIVLTVLLWAGIQRTSVGQRLRAVAEDTEAAGLRGINVRLYVVGTFALAGALAGIAGWIVPAALGHSISIPTAPLLTIYGFVAVVVGGAGSLWGALIGGWLVGLSEAIGTSIEPAAHNLFGLAVLVIVLLVRPQGVFSAPGSRRA